MLAQVARKASAALAPRLLQQTAAPLAAAFQQLPAFSLGEDKPSSAAFYRRGCPGARVGSLPARAFDCRAQGGLGAPHRAASLGSARNPASRGPGSSSTDAGRAGANVDATPRRWGLRRPRAAPPTAAPPLDRAPDPPCRPLPAAYATASELAAAEAAGLPPTVYAMKNPTPAIT